MITIKSTGSIADIISKVQDVPARLVPYAAATALTRCAVIAKTDSLPGAMRRVFDRPTNYALNSLFVQPATKDKLSARVMVKNEAGRGVVPENFMFPEVAGGQRREKGFERALRYGGHLRAGERAMPGQGIKLDAFGNVSGPKVRSVLSAIASQKSTKRRGEVFVGEVRGTRGVWQKKAKRGVMPLFIFTRSQPNYAPRFDFTKVASDTANQHFAPEFNRALSALLTRAQ